jgi:hypothetical protein
MSPWYIFENRRVLKYRLTGSKADLWGKPDQYQKGSWYETHLVQEDRRCSWLEICLLLPSVAESILEAQTSTGIDDKGEG